MDEILKIFPNLHKNLTDLKIEIADLKKNQWENPETSTSRQERIRDALGTVPLLHQKEKAKEILHPAVASIWCRTKPRCYRLPKHREADR
ncbi:UNVERIFIED_CONTAM: hypothetical protein Sradi_4523200 [Sesamum radiatum]|uniref:Uncharacterized protein n=1 Tax=Sesamum radiatum TaxID=300843 RepID=A0AAW2N8I4_SESRA